MELSGSTSLDRLGVGETAIFGLGHWQLLVAGLILAAAVIALRVGRRNAVAAARGTSDLGSRLAEIDPADYDFDGNKKTVAEPAVNFDDFFSNASRRDELKAEPSPPEPEALVFDVPELEALPSPDPEEPPISAEARERLLAITSEVERRQARDPGYALSEEESFALAAFEAYSLCGDGFGLAVEQASDPARFQFMAEVARTVGADDLAAIIDLQIKLLERVAHANLEHPEDEGWQPIRKTADALANLFRQANRNASGTGRFSTLADAYLAGEW